MYLAGMLICLRIVIVERSPMVRFLGGIPVVGTVHVPLETTLTSISHPKAAAISI